MGGLSKTLLNEWHKDMRVFDDGYYHPLQKALYAYEAQLKALLESDKNVDKKQVSKMIAAIEQFDLGFLSCYTEFVQPDV